jgi:hypothetical protein
MGKMYRLGKTMRRYGPLPLYLHDHLAVCADRETTPGIIAGEYVKHLPDDPVFLGYHVEHSPFVVP